MLTLSFDCETALIAPRVLAPELVCVSWATEQGSGLLHHSEAKVHIKAWLEHPDIILVGHNLCFDFGVLVQRFPEFLPMVFELFAQGRVRDTMIRQKLLDIARGEFRGKFRPDGSFEKHTYHLADLARRHLGISMSKGEDTWRKRYIELYTTPLDMWPEDAKSYAIDDARYTLETFKRQHEERVIYLNDNDECDILSDEPAQCRAAWWLHLASLYGIRVDPDKIALLEQNVTREFEELRETLVAEGLVRKTVRKSGEVEYTRDTKVAARRMVSVCGYRYDEQDQVYTPNNLDDPELKDLRLTAKGAVMLDEESCDESGDEILQAYAKYSSLGNVLSKDVARMRAGEIHTSFDSLVASGRTSSRGGFNTQNMRRKGGTRECFVPRPGFVYCMIDLDTAELRAVAQVCLNMFGRSRLADVINEGKDVHCHLTAQALGMPYEEVIAAIEAGDERMKDERQTYKSANFGLWGGMRETLFAALLKRQLRKDVPEAQVHAIREAWLAAWPEAKLYLDWAERACYKGKRVTVVQEYSGRVRGDLKYSEALNTRFQGLVADAAKAAGWAICREMYDPTQGSVLLGSRIVTFVHDEIIAECPETLGHECAMRIQELMLREVGKFLPDVPPKATPVLARCWAKGAKPVYRGGRLVPLEG